MMPIVNSCCCGCSLRTGTMIIIFLNLFVAYNIVDSSYNQELGKTRVIFTCTFSIIWVCAQVVGFYAAMNASMPLLLTPVLFLMAILILIDMVNIVLLLSKKSPFISPGWLIDILYSLRVDIDIKRFDTISIGYSVIYIFIDVYFMVVIFSFTQELNEISEARNLPRTPTV